MKEDSFLDFLVLPLPSFTGGLFAPLTFQLVLSYGSFELVEQLVRIVIFGSPLWLFLYCLYIFARRLYKHFLLPIVFFWTQNFIASFYVIDWIRNLFFGRHSDDLWLFLATPIAILLLIGVSLPISALAYAIAASFHRLFTHLKKE